VAHEFTNSPTDIAFEIHARKLVDAIEEQDRLASIEWVLEEFSIQLGQAEIRRRGPHDEVEQIDGGIRLEGIGVLTDRDEDGKPVVTRSFETLPQALVSPRKGEKLQQRRLATSGISEDHVSRAWRQQGQRI
jgi:hypothetical protein